MKERSCTILSKEMKMKIWNGLADVLSFAFISTDGKVILSDAEKEDTKKKQQRIRCPLCGWQPDGKMTLKENIFVMKKIAVIGGGNVAFDIARSLARSQRNQFGEVNIVVAALEPRDGLLADESEVIEADEEGIQFFSSRGPVVVL